MEMKRYTITIDGDVSPTIHTCLAATAGEAAERARDALASWKGFLAPGRSPGQCAVRATADDDPTDTAVSAYGR